MLGALCMAQMAVMIDNTILNVALPTIGHELGLRTAGLQAVVMGYSLAQAALLLTIGVVADAAGHRRVLVVGLLLFGAGSALAAFAPSGTWLVGARVVMGAGGACLMTSTLAVTTLAFDDRTRVKAIGLWAATGSAAFLAGPLAGGALLESWWWGAIFLVNLPIVAVSLVAVLLLVAPTRGRRLRVGAIGVVAWGGGIACLVTALTLGPANPTAAVTVLMLGVGLLGLFWVVERRAEQPMLPPAVLTVARFQVALVGAALVAFAMGGSLFLLTLDLQVAQGLDPLVAGVRLAPLAATVVVVNVIGVGARAVHWLGTSTTVAAGMLSIAAGMALFGLLRSTGAAGQGAALVVMGVGIGLAMPAMSNALMTALPLERAGVAAGINGTAQELGTSVGVAVLGAVASAVWLGHHEGALSAAQPGAAVAGAITVGQLAGAGVLAVSALIVPILLRRATPAVASAEPVSEGAQ